MKIIFYNSKFKALKSYHIQSSDIKQTYNIIYHKEKDSKIFNIYTNKNATFMKLE